MPHDNMIMGNKSKNIDRKEIIQLANNMRRKTQFHRMLDERYSSGIIWFIVIINRHLGNSVMQVALIIMMLVAAEVVPISTLIMTTMVLFILT